MKSIRIAGLCLVAMFVVSMVAAGSASAAAHWNTCKKEATGTKYETEGCAKTSATGTWAFEEVKGTEEARSVGTLRLIDTKVPIVSKVAVICTGEGEGSVGPGAFSRTTAIKNIKCSAGENCEEVTKTAEPKNLPWQGELAETEKEARNYITAGGEGAGWAVACKVLGISKEDVCTVANSEIPYVTPVNVVTGGTQLVLLSFLTKAPKAKCTIGGASSGEVLGSIGVLMPTRAIGLQFIA
jgi:hypothetical protein